MLSDEQPSVQLHRMVAGKIRVDRAVFRQILDSSILIKVDSVLAKSYILICAILIKMDSILTKSNILQSTIL